MALRVRLRSSSPNLASGPNFAAFATPSSSPRLTAPKALRYGMRRGMVDELEIVLDLEFSGFKFFMDWLLQLQGKRRLPEIGEAVADLDFMTPADRVSAAGKCRLVGAVAD